MEDMPDPKPKPFPKATQRLHKIEAKGKKKEKRVRERESPPCIGSYLQRKPLMPASLLLVAIWGILIFEVYHLPQYVLEAANTLIHNRLWDAHVHLFDVFRWIIRSI